MTGASPGPSYEEVQDEICESSYKDCLERELTIPLNQHIIISRLKARFAFNKYATAKAAEEKATQARIDTASNFAPLWVGYLNECKAVGYCVICDKNLDECKCVAMA